MNNKYIVFLILAVLVIVFLWNKNEHADTTTDNITAKNITTSDSINVGTNLGKLKIGTGSISYGNGDGYGLKLGKEGSPTLTIWDNNWITAKGTLDAQQISASTLTATGPIGGWDVNAKNNINAGGIVTAKKFVSTDGTSATPLSNEAIQSIASVYNKDNLTATNITATNDISAKGNFTATNITAANDIGARGNFTATNITATNDIGARGNLTAKGITATNIVSTNVNANDITAKGNMYTTHLTATGRINAAGINAPTIIGNLMSPSGIKQLVIADNGHVYVTDGAGTYLRSVSPPLG